jgi:hypothetical protein
MSRSCIFYCVIIPTYKNLHGRIYVAQISEEKALNMQQKECYNLEALSFIVKLKRGPSNGTV